MWHKAFSRTVKLYREIIPDVVIIVISLLGGLIATYYDYFGWTNRIGDWFAFGSYTLILFVLTLPIVFICSLIDERVWPPKKSLQTSGKITPTNLEIDIIPIFQAKKKQMCLEIINRGSIDLEDCYLTLVKVNFWSKKFGSKGEDITEIHAPNNPLLSWKGESHDGKKSLSKNGGKAIINIANLTESLSSRSFNFSFHQNINKNIKRQGQFYISIEINAKMSGQEIKHPYSKSFLFQYHTYSGDDPTAGVVHYPLEVSRTMNLKEDGTSDLTIIEFGWMQGESIE